MIIGMIDGLDGMGLDQPFISARSMRWEFHEGSNDQWDYGLFMVSLMGWEGIHQCNDICHDGWDDGMVSDH